LVSIARFFMCICATCFVVGCEEIQPVERQDAGDADSTVTADMVDSLDLNETHDVEDLRDDSEIIEEPSGPWRSVLYPENWLPGMLDEGGRALPDFSYAGFRRGEAPWKDPEPYIQLADFGADPSGEVDSSTAFTEAINSIRRGGTLVIGPGLYRLEGPIEVRNSGVLIQGNGQPRLFFPNVSGLRGRTPISFRGDPKVIGERVLTRDAPAYSELVYLANVRGFQVGDRVWLGHTVTREFAERYQLEASYVGTYQVIHRRTVAEVDVGSSALRLDIPLRQSLKMSDGAKLQKIGGELERVGLRSVSISTSQSGTSTQEYSAHAVAFQYVLDGLIDGVNSFAFEELESEQHLLSGGVVIEDSSLVTVANSSMSHPQNRQQGHGHLFEVRRSNEVLFRDVGASHGAFNFLTSGGLGTSGVVWFRVQSSDGESAFGHALGASNLIDSSVVDDVWRAGFRPVATQNVFWNTSGRGTVQSAQLDWGYIIGTGPELRGETSRPPALKSDNRDPEDWIEGLGRASELGPASLYEDQIRRRLRN